MKSGSRASRLYVAAVIVLSLLALTRQLLHWRYGTPDITIVSVAALAATPFAVRYQVTISESQPDLRLGLLPALLFSADPALDSTILPIWAVLVALGYWLAPQPGRNVRLLTAFQIISGSALLAVSRHIDFGFRPYDRTFLALMTYFAVLALLESLRRFFAEAPGARRLRLRWAWCLLIALGIFYASAAIAVLRRVDNGGGVPLGASIFILMLGALALSAGLILRNRELARSLNSLAAGAVAMPWGRDQIDTNLRRWMTLGLRARHVSTASAAQSDGAGLSAVLTDGHVVAASRDRGDLPFSAIERETFDALASMASVSLHWADQHEHLIRQATTDPLTRLATYSFFRDRLDALNVERDSGEVLGLIIIDLDGFKAVNEAFGHVDGDRIIREIGTRLRVFDGPGLVTRYAGDEFAIALRHVQDLAGLQLAADRIVRLVGEPIRLNTGVAHVQTSLGLALSAKVEASVDDWVREADRQMYRRKRSLHANDMGPEIDLDNAVRRAIIDKRVSSAFQPIVDLQAGRIVMLEALVRVTDPDLGPIAPETLVSIAMRLNLLDEVTRQLAVQTFETMAAAARTGIKFDGVTINLEIVQLDAWSPLLDELVALADTNTAELILEISERSLIAWDEGRRRVVERLQAAGIALAIDDFGSGYSSLGALHAAPASRVKIDKSMIDDIGFPRQQMVLAGMLSLLDELRFEVIVEGVETIEAARILRAMGARWGQGRLFGMPLSQDQLLQRLAAHGDASTVGPELKGASG